jgi:hypothetical protein
MTAAFNPNPDQECALELMNGPQRHMLLLGGSRVRARRF